MKWTGLLLILLGCSAAGISLDLGLLQSIDTLMDIRDMMHFLVHEIEECIPFCEATKLAAAKSVGGCADFLQGVSQKLQMYEGEDIALIWRSQSEVFKPLLKKEDYEAFCHCLDQNGFAGCGDQCMVLNRYVEDLEDRLAVMKKKREETGKLYRTLGVISGLFLCVLFL